MTRNYLKTSDRDFLKEYEEIKRKARAIEQAPVMTVLEPIVPDVIEVEDHEVLEERWMVYYFTLPIKMSKKVAWGFPSKEAAQWFAGFLQKRRPSSIVFEDKHYEICYEVVLESREKINLFYNDPIRTTVGNDLEKIIERWLD